ncbi:MAG: Hsp20/alpha crystallin family protein [Muribaculum sp.]|nr:Hsp20/alpha crystallin family protein [Muribaculum sp.]
MMMPSIFRENLFDSLMEDFAFPSIDRALYGKSAKDLMKTDVQETDTDFVVDIDLPGFKKEDIKMQLANGTLTVNASRSMERDEKGENSSYVRRERYAGSVSRSFYVGNHVTEEDIHPRYENGILTFHIPKEQPQAVEEKEHYISIEG